MTSWGLIGINIPIRKFFEELTTLDALATYIDINLSPEWKIQSQSEKTLQKSAQFQSENSSIEPKIDEKGFETFRETIIQQQLEVMSDIMSKQLEVLQHNGISTQRTFSTKKFQFEDRNCTIYNTLQNNTETSCPWINPEKPQDAYIEPRKGSI